MSLGREALAWGGETWAAIDRGVHEENLRAGVAAKVVPLRGPMPDAVTVPADRIDIETMTVPEGDVVPLVELSTEFALTRQQAELEDELGTAATLSRRGASLLTQAEDLVILRGDAALDGGLVGGAVRSRGTVGPGLVAAAGEAVKVDASGAEDTFKAVARSFSLLQSRAHTGPYALLLDAERYAGTFEAAGGTLVLVAERVRGLVQAFYGTAAMPERRGLLVSVGGDTVDIVIGADPSVAFLAIDDNDLFRFRVFERFALRVKDPSACVRLEFEREG